MIAQSFEITANILKSISKEKQKGSRIRSIIIQVKKF